MLSDAEVLKKRRATIARLERHRCIPPLDAHALYGPAGHIRYVDLPEDIGPPLLKPKAVAPRRSANKHTVG
jgi:hypothetical protein